MARSKPRVTGSKEIGRNAKALKGLTRANVFKGLIAAALLVKKDAQKETPRRTGNLRSGAYVVFPGGAPDAGGGFTGDDKAGLSTRHASVLSDSQAATKAKSRGSNETVAVGFTPLYALSVHENPRSGAPGYESSKDRAGLRAERVHSAKGGWKFLENALKGSQRRIIQAVTAAARLQPGKVRA